MIPEVVWVGGGLRVAECKASPGAPAKCLETALTVLYMTAHCLFLRPAILHMADLLLQPKSNFILPYIFAHLYSEEDLLVIELLRQRKGSEVKKTTT